MAWVRLSARARSLRSSPASLVASGCRLRSGMVSFRPSLSMDEKRKVHKPMYLMAGSKALSGGGSVSFAPVADRDLEHGRLDGRRRGWLGSMHMAPFGLPG